jgi:CRP-like cAMP-binding protein
MILTEELEKVRFARELGAAHLNDLARIARLKVCSPGTELFKEGQDSPFIYFVLRGMVSLRVQEPYGESVEIDTVGPGEVLGWSPVFGRHSMTASATAATECQLAVCEVKQLEELFKRDLEFGLAFLRKVGLQVSERLRSTRRALGLVRTLTHHSPYALRHEGSD